MRVCVSGGKKRGKLLTQFPRIAGKSDSSPSVCVYMNDRAKAESISTRRIRVSVNTSELDGVTVERFVSPDPIKGTRSIPLVWTGLKPSAR